MLLAFLGGDPDRPAIVGVGPNATHPSPVLLGNVTQNVIQSGGGNRIVMEDAQGRQQTSIRSPVQHSAVSVGAGGAHGGNLDLSTGGTAVIDVGGDSTAALRASATVKVKNDLTLKVGGAADQTYGKGLKQEVKDGGLERSVKGGETVTIEGGKSLTISSKDYDISIQNGQIHINANGAISISSGDRIDLGAPNQIVANTADFHETHKNHWEKGDWKLSTFATKTDATVNSNAIHANSNSAVGASTSFVGASFSATGAARSIAAVRSSLTTNQTDFTGRKVDILASRFQRIGIDDAYALHRRGVAISNSEAQLVYRMQSGITIID